MSSEKSKTWNKARQAHKALVRQIVNHPEVTLIDIGYDVDQKSGQTTERIVLRVHVKQPLTREALGLPAELDGIPIRIVVGDYRLE